MIFTIALAGQESKSVEFFYKINPNKNDACFDKKKPEIYHNFW